jgi:hypothetical protein
MQPVIPKRASETGALFKKGPLERNFLGLSIERRFFRHLLFLGPVIKRSGAHLAETLP